MKLKHIEGSFSSEKTERAFLSQNVSDTTGILKVKSQLK
jgi:hypothetical protein